MSADPEYIVHNLEESYRSGFAEEMQTAIEDLLLALRAGEIVLEASAVNDEETDEHFITERDTVYLEYLSDFGEGDDLA